MSRDPHLCEGLGQIAGRAEQVMALYAIIAARASVDSAQDALDLAVRTAVNVGARKSEVADLAGVNRNTL